MHSNSLVGPKKLSRAVSDWARGKRRGFSPGSATRHPQSARVQGRAAAEGFRIII